MLALWQFPRFWYTRTDANLGSFWLAEQTQVDGWVFEDVPVGKAAERLLVADRLFNGEFRRNGAELVRVFSAKRFAESPNEIGLFVHTPDRCWTETGWKMEPTAPEVRAMTLHGISMLLERRIFSAGTNRELVYFGGLVGGQPLPYRLDHNLSVGMKQAMRLAKDRTGSTLRASDERFWARVWDAFLARRPLIGPKQFVRISTPISDGNPVATDELLVRFLAAWLLPVDYNSELDSWKRNKAKLIP
jgi:hypothetical protein